MESRFRSLKSSTRRRYRRTLSGSGKPDFPQQCRARGRFWAETTTLIGGGNFTAHAGRAAVMSANGRRRGAPARSARRAAPDGGGRQSGGDGAACAIAG